MSSTLLLLFISALCGVGFGYAAQRGSLCVISGIEVLLTGRSPRVFLSFLRCSVWVVAISVPLAWLTAGDQLAPVMAPLGITIVGGLLFGAGAAINGGCSFGTLIRLGGGDASFIATLAGIGFGFFVQRYLPGLDPASSSPAPSPLEQINLESIAVLALAILFCAREVLIDRRRAYEAGPWPPERAALMMGVTGGVLYAIHGSWAYTIAIERGLGTMMGGGIPPVDLVLIFLACVAGAALGAGQLHQLRFHLNARDIPKHLLGGTIMGVGAALIPGGNDVLVLHDLPALSPHAPVAYISLVLGGMAMILLRRVASHSVTLLKDRP